MGHVNRAIKSPNMFEYRRRQRINAMRGASDQLDIWQPAPGATQQR
jgi:hypothetical protein